MAKYVLFAVLTSFCYGFNDQASFASPAEACTGKSAFAPGFYDENTEGNSVPVGDIERYFGVYVPKSYDPSQASKVIYDFHGAHGTPAGQYNNSMYYLNEVGQDYLVIYPLGVGNIWQVDPHSTTDDFAYVEALLPFISQKYCIDTARTFASGKSQGGGFVDQLACSSLGDNFAAFAMASPALYQHWNRDMCRDTKPRKILEAHGSFDEVIRYGGCLNSNHCHHNDGQLPSISDWVWWWATTDGYTTRQDIDLDTRTVSTVAYIGNSNGGVVQHYYIHHNGHCWPQTGPPYNTDYTKSRAPTPPPIPLNCFSFLLDFTDKVVQFFEAAVAGQTGLVSDEL